MHKLLLRLTETSDTGPCALAYAADKLGMERIEVRGSTRAVGSHGSRYPDKVKTTYAIWSCSESTGVNFDQLILAVEAYGARNEAMHNSLDIYLNDQLGPLVVLVRARGGLQSFRGCEQN